MPCRISIWMRILRRPPMPVTKDHYGVVAMFKIMMFTKIEFGFLAARRLRLSTSLTSSVSCGISRRRAWAYASSGRAAIPGSIAIFGAYVTLPTESANLTIKSYLLNGRNDITPLRWLSTRLPKNSGIPSITQERQRLYEQTKEEAWKTKELEEQAQGRSSQRRS